MVLRLKILLSLLILAALVGVAFYTLSNTRLELSGSSLQDGSLTVETNLPNAKCRKVLKRSFPFVELECHEKSSDGEE